MVQRLKGIIHKKYQYQYSTGMFLNYTKTLVQFKKIRGSSPVFVNCENQGSELDKYPQIFRDNIFIVSYGVDGVTDHVDSDVYDYHHSYEIDKTQMKMPVPLNLNANKLINVSLDKDYNNSVATVKYMLKI